LAINLFPLDDIMVCSIEGEIVSLKIRSSFEGDGGGEGKRTGGGKKGATRSAKF
jgi:hypothetical protein